MANPKLPRYECSQCGGTDLKRSGENEMRCEHCGSVFAVAAPDEPRVVIRKGANVTFGKNANVEIRGGLEIEAGARVELNGKLTLIQKGDENLIEQARQKKAKD